MTVTSTFLDPADFTTSATSAFHVTGMQFFTNGVNVTRQVTPTFASGHSYHIGAPQQIAVVPEPQTVALLATGLLGIGAVARRRRRL